VVLPRARSRTVTLAVSRQLRPQYDAQADAENGCEPSESAENCGNPTQKQRNQDDELTQCLFSGAATGLGRHASQPDREGHQHEGGRQCRCHDDEVHPQ
jgi:hypothetical protein